MSERVVRTQRIPTYRAAIMRAAMGRMAAVLSADTTDAGNNLRPRTS
jgi:hypothetical protein